MAKELYVGHLPFEATEHDLRRLFSVAGTVTSVHIITDPINGKSKGCGYVRMSCEAELQEAINCLDGALMENMTITVSIARPQKQQPPNRPGNSRRAIASRKPKPAAQPPADAPPGKPAGARKPVAKPAGPPRSPRGGRPGGGRS